MRPRQPRDEPRVYFAAFVVLLAASVAFPDGFLLVALAAGVVVVAATIVLAATGRFRQFK
jgi:hypothetical protein